MARKLRIQYEGAIYHVINRGNYRQDVFSTVGTAQAFETTLFEACALVGWKLHAHVVMRNHYHLAVETPQANLVEGMHWLQSTFATRFNRFRNERGHLFQGRYQALLVENTAALARVVDYIHLNPVRARIVPFELLADFRWSSLRRFLRGPRPECLVAADWLEQRGLRDSKRGLKTYLTSLQTLAEDEAAQKQFEGESLSQGWAVGTRGWRRALAKEYAHKALDLGIEATQLRELKELNWSQTLDGALEQAGQTREEAALSRANVPWKIAVAAQLRAVGAPFPWIAQQLQMGSASTVRVYHHRTKSST